MTPTVRRITAAREPLWNLTLAGPRMFCAAQLDYPALLALLVACQDAVAQHRRATEETARGQYPATGAATTPGRRRSGGR